MLPLQLGDIWVAVDPTLVQEMLGSRTWVRVPGAAPQLPGVISWRSRAIAVLELGDMLGVGARSSSAAARTVVARVTDCTFAFFVDSAREVRTIDASALEPPHAVSGRFVTQQLSLDNQVMPLIDLAAVIEAVSRSTGGVA
ncbi:MAG TPA: chemotaxis protein CheW [Kofleriaceae bacterium]|nr:chemotaxis protein CheW [Kofleriaceae bacterium]